MEKVAFVGLGAMGYPMAAHLSRRFPTLVWNRTFEKALRHQEEFGSLAVPLEGVAEAILPDGSLLVQGVRIGAGEVALVSPLRTGEPDP